MLLFSEYLSELHIEEKKTIFDLLWRNVTAIQAKLSKDWGHLTNLGPELDGLVLTRTAQRNTINCLQNFVLSELIAYNL